MTQQDIKKRIKELNKIVEENFNPTSFVLNKETNKALQEISKLQQECQHEYENGVCIYCDFYKEENI